MTACWVCGSVRRPQMPLGPTTEVAAELLGLRPGAPASTPGCYSCVAALLQLKRLQRITRRRRSRVRDNPVPLPFAYHCAETPSKKPKLLDADKVNADMIDPYAKKCGNDFSIFYPEEKLSRKKQAKKDKIDLVHCSRDIFESQDDFVHNKGPTTQESDDEDEEFNLTPNFNIISNLHK